ncbi:MAG: phage virion morphogenesis protein [Treponema sp.]|nr:phage virion morphogenesis protein [Treponema sp.]
MGVAVVNRLELAERLKGADWSETMRKISLRLASSAVRKINSNVPPENAPLTQAVKQGANTLRDNGQLMASVAPQSGSNWAAAATNMKQAKILQYGGTIAGKGKGLWIPAGAETRRLMRRHNAQKPSELIKAMRGDGWSFYRRGKAFFAKKKKGEPFVLFVIKDSVKIPARPFLYLDDKDKKEVNAAVKKAVRKALGGKK